MKNNKELNKYIKNYNIKLNNINNSNFDIFKEIFKHNKSSDNFLIFIKNNIIFTIFLCITSILIVFIFFILILNLCVKFKIFIKKKNDKKNKNLVIFSIILSIWAIICFFGFFINTNFLLKEKMYIFCEIILTPIQINRGFLLNGEKSYGFVDIRNKVENIAGDIFVKKKYVYDFIDEKNNIFDYHKKYDILNGLFKLEMNNNWLNPHNNKLEQPLSIQKYKQFYNINRGYLNNFGKNLNFIENVNYNYLYESNHFLVFFLGKKIYKEYEELIWDKINSIMNFIESINFENILNMINKYKIIFFTILLTLVVINIITLFLVLNNFNIKNRCINIFFIFNFLAIIVIFVLLCFLYLYNIHLQNYCVMLNNYYNHDYSFFNDYLFYLTKNYKVINLIGKCAKGFNKVDLYKEFEVGKILDEQKIEGYYLEVEKLLKFKIKEETEEFKKIKLNLKKFVSNLNTNYYDFNNIKPIINDLISLNCFIHDTTKHDLMIKFKLSIDDFNNNSKCNDKSRGSGLYSKLKTFFDSDKLLVDLIKSSLSNNEKFSKNIRGIFKKLKIKLDNLLLGVKNLKDKFIQLVPDLIQKFDCRILNYKIHYLFNVACIDFYKYYNMVLIYLTSLILLLIILNIVLIIMARYNKDFTLPEFVENKENKLIK